MKEIDTIIHARWIVPIEPDEIIHEHYCVALHEGKIVGLLPSTEATSLFTPRVTIKLDQHALIPGLVNTHTHAAMSLFRGLADDLPLMDWLTRHIWPAEGTWVNSEFVYDGTQLAIVEMIRSGTTCFNDMYFFPNEAARAASHAGIRAVLGLILIDFPTAWASDADEYLEKGLALQDHYRNDSLISTAFAPHAPYTVSDSPLSRVQTLADELDIPIHMHVHETAHEIETSNEQYRMRPIKRLEQIGLLSPRLIAVHMTQLTDKDIDLLAATGCNVIHCPESNLKLASGYCPVARLIDAGINVALGTDGAASNNDLDMFGELKTAALLAKAVANNASAVPASTALRMATLNGAQALGLGDETGSISVGKAADLVAVDLGGLDCQPVYNPVSHLVYAITREKVTDVWIGGKHVLKNRVLTTMDEHRIKAKSIEWQQKIANSDQQ
ncbi:MAG: TRZ/ATZ family hydrolase [Gammaproteobacteria bacterium]